MAASRPAGQRVSQRFGQKILIDLFTGSLPFRGRQQISLERVVAEAVIVGGSGRYLNALQIGDPVALHLPEQQVFEATGNRRCARMRQQVVAGVQEPSVHERMSVLVPIGELLQNWCAAGRVSEASRRWEIRARHALAGEVLRRPQSLPSRGCDCSARTRRTCRSEKRNSSDPRPSSRRRMPLTLTLDPLAPMAARSCSITSLNRWLRNIHCGTRRVPLPVVRLRAAALRQFHSGAEHARGAGFERLLRRGSGAHAELQRHR